MQPSDLLPVSSTQLEKDLADVIHICLGDYSFANLNDPYSCPAELLDWLAWMRCVDTWDSSWPIDRKRDVIAAMPAINLRAGTIGSIRRAIRAAGFGEIEIIR